MTNRYLMCAPDYFEVAYVINPWMEGNVALGQRYLAQRQWQDLVAILTTIAHVDRVAPVAGVPDMVFTANAGLILGNTVVLSHFRHAERQGEEEHFANWFASQGFKVKTIPEDLAFEGAGDALLDRRESLLWQAHGHRSSVQCVPIVANMLDIDVEPLRLVDDRFYHLDTCFCPLEDGYLMYYPAAFDEASQARIAARVPLRKRIVVSDNDALDFACNAVNCGQHIVLNRASDALVQELASHGFRIHQTPLSEFMKAGGSAKCLTLKLNESLLPTERAVA